MTSPDFTPLTGSLTLQIGPSEVDSQTLNEALSQALKGKVWEVLSREQTPAGLVIHYRALPSGVWERMKRLPQREWSIIPDFIHAQENQKTCNWAQRAAVWGLMALCGVGIITEGWRLVDIVGRGRNLSETGASLAVSKSLPQRGWVAQMNTLYDKLAQSGVGLRRFGWGQDGLVVEFNGGDASAQREWLESSGFKNFQRKGDLWTVRN